MGVFWVQRDYTEEFDIREYGDLPQQIQTRPPAGFAWLLLLRRRGRKTWTLKGLRSRVGLDNAAYVDLSDRRIPGVKGRPGFCHLMDEPAHLLEKEDTARELLEAFRNIAAADERILLALTPKELQQIAQLDAEELFVSRDDARIRLAPFSKDEARKQASRLATAETMLQRIPESWSSSPFLVEFVLEIHEKHPDLEPKELVRAAVQECDKYKYMKRVFHESLSENQRDSLSKIVNNLSSVIPPECKTLVEAGYLSTNSDDTLNVSAPLADPILQRHLYPLRIHHLSDIHFGYNTAHEIDAKKPGSIADAAGASAALRDGYVTHLESLKSRGRAPHLVVISGDIGEHAQPAEYEEALQFIARLRENLQRCEFIEGSPILLVGGNHDVQWDAVEGAVQARHERFAGFFPTTDYHRPQLEVPPDVRTLARTRLPEFGVEFLLLGSAEVGGEVDAAIRHGEELRLGGEPEAKTKAIKAARSDPGLVHHQELTRASAHDWREQVKIAVLHHPITALPSVEVAPYANLVNGGAVKEMLLAKKFALVLHGHVHSAFFVEERWPGHFDDWMLRIASAPSLGSRSVIEKHGYNEIEIRRSVRVNQNPGIEYVETISDVTVRRVLRSGGHNWETDRVLGPFKPGQVAM